MKSFFKFLGACSFGFSAVSLLWLAVELDNAELQAGKSPHSGFCPESPSPMKAFDGFSKPSRPHGMRKQWVGRGRRQPNPSLLSKANQ